MAKMLYRISNLETITKIVERLKSDLGAPSIGSSDQNGVLLEFKGGIIVEINPLLTKSLDVRFVLTVFSRTENETFKNVNALIKELI